MEVYSVVVAIVAISSMTNVVLVGTTGEDGCSGVDVSGDAAASCSVEGKSIEVTGSGLCIKEGSIQEAASCESMNESHR